MHLHNPFHMPPKDNIRLRISGVHFYLAGLKHKYQNKRQEDLYYKLLSKQKIVSLHDAAQYIDVP